MLKSNRSRKTRLAWVTLGVGLLASGFAALAVRQAIEQDAVRQFAFGCDQVALKVQERLGAYALILRGGAALFAASATVQHREWRAYVETLRAGGSVPGIQGIGFAEVIPPEELAAHLERIRGEGFPDYSGKGARLESFSGQEPSCYRSGIVFKPGPLPSLSSLITRQYSCLRAASRSSTRAEFSA